MENLSVAWKRNTDLKIELFQDAKEQWCWRVLAVSGAVMALSDEGFDSKSKCIENLKKFGSTIVSWAS